MGNNTELQNLREIASTAKEQLDMLHDLVITSVENQGLHKTIIPLLRKFTKAKMETLTDDEIRSILEQPVDDKKFEYEDNLSALKYYYDLLQEDSLNDNPEVRDIDKEDSVPKTFEEYCRSTLLYAHESIGSYEEARKEYDVINNDYTRIRDEQYRYFQSDEYMQAKQEKLASLKESLNDEIDEFTKAKLKNTIMVMENVETLDFLFTRINDIGEKEIKNIMNIFFDSKRSKYTVDKYREKLPKFGIDVKMVQSLYDMEEKILDEKYHVFNNLFLFAVMRFISYADPSSQADTAYVSAVVGKMYGLLTKESGEHIQSHTIEIIKKYLDFFIEYADIFEDKNITQPNHEKCIAERTERDQQLRIMVIAALENRGIEVDSMLSTDELIEQLREIEIKAKKEYDEMIDVDIPKEATDEEIEELSEALDNEPTE